MAVNKRPCYAVEKKLGFMAVGVDGELEEAVIVFGLRQSRAGADVLRDEMIAAGHEDAEVVKRFIVSE